MLRTRVVLDTVVGVRWRKPFSRWPTSAKWKLVWANRKENNVKHLSTSFVGVPPQRWDFLIFGNGVLRWYLETEADGVVELLKVPLERLACRHDDLFQRARLEQAL